MNKEFSGYFSSWFVNYVADVARAPFTDHLSTGAMSTGYAATKAAAMTNPSNSPLDLGVSAGETREIPHLVRERGNRMLREAGNSYLTYKFGAVPIARDLINLYRLPQSVDATVRKIQELKLHGLRNTVTLGSWSATGSQFRWVQTNGAFIGGNFDAETLEQVRAHVRWAPSVELSQLNNPAEIRALATQAASGATIDFQTIWNLMPWSWLIDWFSSLGDYFAANRNTIPARLQDLVVMRHTYTREFWAGGTFADAYGVPIHVEPIISTRESKIRQPWPPDPFSIYLPFLNSGQVAILGALAASRSH